MEIEHPQNPRKKNIYHELFKSQCELNENPQESFENKMIHIGLIHNALGLAFINFVKCTYN